MTEQGSNERTESAFIHLANDLGELERLHAFFERIGEQSGWPERLRWDFTLSCEELLTNTINYGYPHGGNHCITIAVRVGPGWVEVVMEDEGIPFNPLERKEPDLALGVDERAIGGLGIYFVRQVMDEVKYERTERGNRIFLHKIVGGASS